MKGKETGLQHNDSYDGDVAGLWDLKIEPVSDSEGKILSGLCIGATLPQNIANLLAMFPGEIKTLPTVGVGLTGELLNTDLLGIRHRIRAVFPEDGLRIKKLDLYDLAKIDIDAEYE